MHSQELVQGYTVTFGAQTGARLKEARKKLGWTQQQAADAAGVRREMWARYEAGAKLGAGAMAALAKAGVDLHHILTGDARDTPKAYAPPMLVEHLHREMHERLREELNRIGVNVAQAARSAGLPSAQGLRDVLAQRKRLSAELLAQMVKIGVDAMYVLLGARYAHDAPTAAIDQREAALLANWRAASEEGKKSIEVAARAMAQVAAAAASPTPAARSSRRRTTASGSHSIAAGGNVVVVNHT